MSSPAPATPSLACPSCSAPQPTPPPDRRYIRCEHCGTTAFLDLGGLRRHLVAEPRLTEADAAGVVRAAGGVATHIELHAHPFWEFTGAGRSLALDAAPDSPPELSPRPLASGRRHAVEPGASDTLEPPTLRPGAAATEASRRLDTPLGEEAATLVHHPLYLIHLAGGQEIWVDGVEGEVVEGEVGGAGSVAFPFGWLVIAAACGLLLPAPFSIFAALAAAAWPLRRFLGTRP